MRRRHLLGCRAGIEAGLLDAEAAAPPHGIRRHNPSLFDLVLKRMLRDGSARLHASVFDTRRQFAAPSATVATPSRGETA
jgi:hypothetical protein